MSLSIEILDVSCRGAKDEGLPNQDFVQITDRDDFLVVSVSDGLGSAKCSLNGAKVACEVSSSMLLRHYSTVELDKIGLLITQKWEEEIKNQSDNLNDFSTANSFVLVNKRDQKIIIGQLGDVLVALRLDGDLMRLNIAEKDFINETESLGSGKKVDYLINSYSFKNSFEFLVATDGIGDELVRDKLDELFDYLIFKYKKINIKQRSRILRKEISKDLNEKNNDDKSLVFVWSKII